ncbi:MAG: hypothetical protein H6Q69_1289 [Firmicutes bacterium]|nr:hypothetical protein [Bacillota bacterium]
MKNLFSITFGLLLVLGICYFQQTCDAQSTWTWYFSDDHVSDYYNPESLKVVKDDNGNIDHVEMCIKTTYDEAGKNATINSYKLSAVQKINELQYRLVKIYIYPEQRKILFYNTGFYNENGDSLWSEEESNSLGVEVVPTSANERYYSIICDLAFNAGQQIYFTQWKQSKDRWIDLDYHQNTDGSMSGTWFDKNTIELNGNLISIWEWNRIVLDNVVIGDLYYKYEYDLSTKKSKLKIVSAWTKEKREYYHSYDNEPWKAYIIGSVGESEYQTIKKYVEEHRTEIMESMHIK